MRTIKFLTVLFISLFIFQTAYSQDFSSSEMKQLNKLFKKNELKKLKKADKKLKKAIKYKKKADKYFEQAKSARDKASSASSKKSRKKLEKKAKKLEKKAAKSIKKASKYFAKNNKIIYGTYKKYLKKARSSSDDDLRTDAGKEFESQASSNYRAAQSKRKSSRKVKKNREQYFSTLSEAIQMENDAVHAQLMAYGAYMNWSSVQVAEPVEEEPPVEEYQVEDTDVVEATTDVEEEAPPAPPVIFSVQIIATAEPLTPRELDMLNKQNQNVEQKREDGLFKYSVGSFTSYEEAEQLRDNLRSELSTRDAFVVAYQEGQKIEDILQAIELSKK